MHMNVMCGKYQSGKTVLVADCVLRLEQLMPLSIEFCTNV